MIYQNNNEKYEEVQKETREIPERIKKENPYLSKVNFWEHHERKVQIEKMQKRLDQKYHLSLIQQLEQQDLNEMKELISFSKNLFDHKQKDKSFRYRIAQEI